MARAWKLTMREDEVAELVLDLPEAADNTLNVNTLEELNDLLRELRDRSGVRCLVVRSAKPECFIAGSDLNELYEINDPAAAEQHCASGQQLMDRIESLPYPTIAVIHGSCSGSGLELALACNFRVATDSPKTVFSLPEVSHGVIPAFGGTQRLPRLIGAQRALPMLVFGETLGPVPAFEIGLVDFLAAEAFLEETVKTVTTGIGRRRTRKAVARHRKARGLRDWFRERTPLGQRLMYERAKREALRRTGGNQPAPLECIEVVRKGLSVNIHRGLTLEREVFGLLAPARASKNLIRLELTRQSVRDGHAPSAMMRFNEPWRVGIHGAGEPAGRIAAAFAVSGITTVIQDSDWSRLSASYAAAAAGCRSFGTRRKLTVRDLREREMRLTMHRIIATAASTALRDEQIVVETVSESSSEPAAAVAALEQALTGKPLIVSTNRRDSTDALASGLTHPERFSGVRFFDPAHGASLVEIVPGTKTARETTAHLARLALQIGGLPVIVGDCAGSFINRVVIPYLNDAAVLAEEGVDFARIDQVFCDYGMPIGPFQLIDELGIHTVRGLTEAYAAAYGERMRPSGLFAALKAHDALQGRRTGKGFYLYAQNRRQRANSEVTARISRAFPHRSNLIDEDVLRRPLYLMLNETARCLEEQIAPTPAIADLALVTAIGFPAFRGGILRWADELEPREIVKTMTEYTRRFGPRYRPAALLKDLGERRAYFYDAVAHRTPRAQSPPPES